MAKMFFVRHCLTPWNEAGRYQGSSDVGLGAFGLKQAQGLRARLAGQSFDAVYCSDLKRAMETAQAVLDGRGVTPVFCPELREIDFGECEGLTYDQIHEKFPEIDWWKSPNPYTILPGGESVAQLADRVRQFMPLLKQHGESENILVVTSGGTIRALLCCLLGIGLENWWSMAIDGASVSIVSTFANRTLLVSLNDTCHLKDLG